MKDSDVKVGGEYACKVSGCLAVVRIDRVNPNGGWIATNLNTGRSLFITDARRLGPAAQ